MGSFFNKLTGSSEKFIKAFEEQNFLVEHNLKDSIEELLETPMLQSFEALFENWTAPVDVHLPKIRDEISSISVSTNEAQKHFAEGQSLLFNDIDRFNPNLEPWLEDIRKGLKLSEHTFARSLVYATPKGGGNAAHFDQNINFVLQAHGEKKWWLAKNEHVKNPLSRHVIGLETDPELGAYSEAMPESFPADAEEHLLKPGSLLFVPPGVWHKTEALSDAVSLNFTFTAPSWLDLLTLAIRGRLLQSEHWRETARGFDTEESQEKFDYLLHMLSEDVETWQAEDIFGALERTVFNLKQVL